MQFHIAPIERETPNYAGFSGLLKSIELENVRAKKFSIICLYQLVAFADDENVPVTMPSKNFTLNPNNVSLNPPSNDPFNSENNVNLLLGYTEINSNNFYSSNIAN